MSRLRMPYQCLKKCGNLLIAARGSSIDTFNLENRSLVSTWKCPSTQNSKPNITLQEETAVASPSTVTESAKEQSTPPAKRRKLSISEEPEKPKQKSGKGKNHRSDAATAGLEAPAVIALAATRGGQHVAAVTGEDKSIRVFKIDLQQDPTYELKQISQRAMPKRPCAIAITEDDTTLISADKFGDVFSLPLIIPEVPLEPVNDSTAINSTPDPEESKPFTPAANNLTVHSVRNRRALENQKRQTKNKLEKIAPTFEHKLLLGHVSMLTDAALLTYNGRQYIFTADRDEHIRISRGIPQTHVIEQFCLGHTEFVSRLCIPTARPEILISGGGDDDLFVWDWENGLLISRADLKSHVEVVHHANGKAAADGSVEGLRIAVSNIQHTRLGNEDMVLVSCEAIPALFVFLLTPTNTLQHIQRLQLPGNVLSFDSSPESVIVSVDTIHTPFSTSVLRNAAVENINPLQAFKFEDQRLIPAAPFETSEQQVEMTEVAAGRWGNLLYGLENLRKRDGEGKEEE